MVKKLKLFSNPPVNLVRKNLFNVVIMQGNLVWGKIWQALFPFPHLQIFIFEVSVHFVRLSWQLICRLIRPWQTYLIFIINLVKPLVRPLRGKEKEPSDRFVLHTSDYNLTHFSRKNTENYRKIACSFPIPPTIEFQFWKLSLRYHNVKKNCMVNKLTFVSTLVVPTFDTKVTEYLCSGWVFLSSNKIRLFN